MRKPINNEVVSFRVPPAVKAQIDKVADELPRGTVSKVLSEVFLPAFERYVKKREKKAEAATV